MEFRPTRQEIHRVLRCMPDIRARCQRIDRNWTDEGEAVDKTPDGVDVMPTEKAKAMIDEGNMDARRTSRLQNLSDGRFQARVDLQSLGPEVPRQVAKPR